MLEKTSISGPGSMCKLCRFEAVQKKHLQSWGLSSAEEFNRCGRPLFLVQKILDFSKFMVGLHGQGVEGIEPVRTFLGQEGRGVNFSRFCADVFYGRTVTQNIIIGQSVATFFTESLCLTSQPIW